MSAEDLTRDLFAGANKPLDSRNPTDLERKHTPSIDAPNRVKPKQRFSVTVEVGKALPHPSERKHFIEFIDLYADDVFLARTDLTAVNTQPKVTFCLSLPTPATELKAYARCNLHGVWVESSPITVSP